MNQSPPDNSVGQAAVRATGRHYQKDFWIAENLKFSEPHYRMRKAANIIERFAGGEQRTLLDVGCGPTALSRILPANISYYGIDIAIQQPAPNLIEADILKTPIGFDGLTFDIVHAEGIFEYVGDVQSQKFAEIASIMRPGGMFIATYWNFSHRAKETYWAHTNVQTINEFCADLSKNFSVDRLFPTALGWDQHWPGRKLDRFINMHLNINIPVLSPKLAVEYFVCCSRRVS